MGASVNRIPSINLPITTGNGTIHPIWYEFLRSFISGANETDPNAGGSGNVTAGAGLTGGGAVNDGVNLDVGAGPGIKVNADDVELDIINLVNSQAAFEDEVIISDASDLSRTRKTSIRDITNLVPGATPGGNNTEVQYNNAGAFGGDANFTTDGSGSVSITGDLTVDNISINGNTVATDASTNPFIFEVPAGSLNQYTFTQSGAGSSAFTANFKGLKSSASIVIRSDADDTTNLANAILSFATNADTAQWSMGLYDSQDDDFVLSNAADLNTNQIFTVDRGTDAFTHHTAVTLQADTTVETFLFRSVTAGITASTTQTQGNGALTTEVNEVSTVANTNDTVTLPTAVTGQQAWVINNGANTLQIFPASSDDLGAGVNAATTLAAGSKAVFIAYDATNWAQVV